MDREQLIRERAYKIWEDEGRPDGAHDDHWKRAEDADVSAEQETDDVTEANQEADKEFVGSDGDRALDSIRPPPIVSPD